LYVVFAVKPVRALAKAALAEGAGETYGLCHPFGSWLPGFTADVNALAGVEVPHQNAALLASIGPFVPFMVASKLLIPVAISVSTEAIRAGPEAEALVSYI
jgi:hypothetical protein